VSSELILDETDVIVPEWRLRKAAESPALRGYFGHSKLREIIRGIDGAPSFKKKQRLRHRMKEDKDFRIFIDDLLREMGYLNENGQFEVTNASEIQKPVLKPIAIEQESEEE
jgi:hypothetical protein